MSLLGKLTSSSSEFINKRGIYAGRRSTKIHVFLYRKTSGRIGGALPGWPHARIALVDHTGAKSGTKRTSPVMYHQYGDAIVVAGSKGGQPTHPAWFHNIMANPNTTIQIGPEVRKVHARMATDKERAHLWKELVAMFPGYDVYQRNAKGRTIPIVILDPCQLKLHLLLEVDGLLDPAVTLFSIRCRGELLAIGALKRLDDQHVEAFAPARSLYVSAGFAPCEPFGDYRRSSNSTYMTMRISERRAQSRTV